MRSFDKALTFRYPLKGWNTVAAFEEQPPLTSRYLVNTRPFDTTTGTARGGSRCGTRKLFTDVIEAAAVRMLAQAIVQLDPDRVLSPTPLLDEPFTFSNGALYTVSTGTWDTWAGIVNGGTHDVTKMLISGGILVNNAATCTARYVAPLTLTSAYSVEVSFKEYANAAAHSTFIRLMAHMSASTGATFLDGTIAVQLNMTVGATRQSVLNSIQVTNGENLVKTQVTNIGIDLTAAVILKADMAENRLRVYIGGNLQLDMNLTLAGSAGQYVGLAVTAPTGLVFLDNFKVYSGVNAASYRQSDLIAVIGSNLCIGDLGGLVSLDDELANDPNALPQCAIADNRAYILVAGTFGPYYNYWPYQVNLLSRTLEDYSAAAGSTPEKCTLCCIWGGRLVLAAPTDGQQNWFMGRIGGTLHGTDGIMHDDWDYSQTDAAAAVAGDGSTASTWGKLGDMIIALIPASADVLLFMCDHTIYAMTGNPKAGGMLDIVSDGIGIMGPNAWTKDPGGMIYFVGTGGFYRMAPGGLPENLSSGSVHQYFKAIDRDANYVTCRWDRDGQGCWIFVTPRAGTAGTHLWYDARTEGFFPMQFPAAHGPVSALVYDGDLSKDRFLFMGGTSNSIFTLDETLKLDDGTAVASYVLMGPVRPVDELHEFRSLALHAYLGERNPNWPPGAFTWKLLAGQTAQEVGLLGTKYVTGSISLVGITSMYGGSINSARLRGGAFSLLITPDSTSNFWTFEKFVLVGGVGAKMRL